MCFYSPHNKRRKLLVWQWMEGTHQTVHQLLPCVLLYNRNMWSQDPKKGWVKTKQEKQNTEVWKKIDKGKWKMVYEVFWTEQTSRRKRRTNLSLRVIRSFDERRRSTEIWDSVELVGDLIRPRIAIGGNYDTRGSTLSSFRARRQLELRKNRLVWMPDDSVL